MGRDQFEEMDRIFHPRSLAVVGVTERISNQGLSFLIGHKRMGFKGRLYAIHPSKKIREFETYPSLMDVPGPVDYVKISVRAQSVPGVVRDCVKKGVRCVTIFSSGFRESNTPDGMRLEDEIKGIAREGGIRIIGPNCMGLYCPESGLTIRADIPGVSRGGIGLISQSGGITISLVLAGSERGLGFSKGVSYGNESDLGPPEFLYYMARDDKTKVICLYIEGTERPEELKAALKDASARKPVIILKGGITEEGNRAVSSHTGAMTGSSEIWEALARQTGALMTEDTDEMLDLAATLSLSGPPPGNRIGLLSVSGGFGVLATDLVSRAGFRMPAFAPETQADLLKYIDAPGTSIKNPVDMAIKFFEPQNYNDMFSAMDRDPEIDAFIFMCAMEYLGLIGSKTEQMATSLTRAAQDALKKMSKPVYVVFLQTAYNDIRLELERSFIREGFPVFPTPQRCLLAIKRAMQLNNERKG